MQSFRRVFASALVLSIPLIPSSIAFAVNPDDVHWDNRFAGTNGVDRPIRAIAVDGANVYVGGEFNTVGGVWSRKVARWDGAQWYSISSDIDNDSRYVTDLVVWNGDLYASGTFLSIGGVPANRIARWDGVNWNAMGGGSTAVVYALAVFNNELYAGGSQGLLRWDGASWQVAAALSAGGRIYTIRVDGSGFYAAGGFTSIGGTAATHIARWDGSAWQPLPAALTGACSNHVNSVVVTGTGVLVAGEFTRETGEPESILNVAGWDGADWVPLASGVTRTPTYMCDEAWASAAAVYGSDVIFGGYWETADGQAIANLARWDGSAWSSLGTPPNGGVNDVVEAGGKLYVGGGFTSIGGKPSNCFAIYDPALLTGVPTPSVASLSLEQNIPNPFNPQTRLEYRVDRAARVTFEVVNVRGEVVRTLVNRQVPAGLHSVTWDGRDMRGNAAASGVYLFRLSDDRETVVRKGVLLK